MQFAHAYTQAEEKEMKSVTKNWGEMNIWRNANRTEK